MGNYLAERGTEGTGGTGLPLVCHTIRSTAARQHAALFYVQDKFKLGRSGEMMSHTGSKLGSGASFDIFPLFEGVSASMLSTYHFNQYLFVAVSYKVILISFLI